MADSNKDKASVNSNAKDVVKRDDIKSDDSQSDADHLSRDWKSRLNHMNDKQLTESPDILVAILFLILTDNGFIPVYNQDEKHLYNTYYKLPTNWKTESPGKYCFKFILSECFDFSCNFIAVVLGELLIINAVCSYPEVVHNVSLKIYDHIVYQNNTHDIDKSQILLYTFKDKIVTPCRCSAYSYRGIPSPCLTGLPKEILEYIFVLSGPKAVCSLMCTSRLLRMLSRDQIVWHTLYLQEFDDFISNSVDDDAHDWYERYRDAYVAKEDLRLKYLINFRNVANSRRRIFY